MTKLTEGARSALEAYLTEARRSFADRTDVDADDAVADLREHVRAVLVARCLKRATTEDVTDVLERLGPPGAWPAAGGPDIVPRAAIGSAARGWWLAVGVALLVLLLGPATLVWRASQTGGMLEGLLARHIGMRGTGHPTAYWVTMGVLAGAVTGGWWVLLGWLARRFRRALRHALGAAFALLPTRSGDVLIVTGLAVLLVSLVGLWV
ncbi:MAG: hypothetical protein P8099_06625 [Gemmatimonadota bacterium]|jgi:hypothetical protein